MHSYTRPKTDARPKLELQVEVLLGGSLILRSHIPADLECKVMVAMRNSSEKKCFKEGILEILLPCLKNSSPRDKTKKVTAFCRWLSIRSDIRVSAYV